MSVKQDGLHYDLSFLEPTKPWMPREDTERLNRYEFARESFELTPEDALEQIFPKGLLDLRDWKEFGRSIKLLGFPRLLTLKTADMVIGEPPLIKVQAKEKKVNSKDDKKSDEFTERIKEIRNDSLFDFYLKQGLFDYSRFGVLLIRIFKNEVTGKANLVAWNPKEWIPVFYNDGTRRIKYNVIGWYESAEILKVQIHSTEDGSFEERTLVTDGAGTIVTQKGSKRYNTKSGKPLFFAVPNTPTTTSPMGTSDYSIIYSLMQKAIERLMAILRVLDEHADPSMAGPSSLLEKSDKGDLVFKTSKYYAVGPDEQEPKYIVWEANLDSSFKAFELLCEQIYTLSEMGTAFLGVAKSTGNAVSGTAMRFKMISPLEKARRISNDLTQPIKQIISSMLSIEKIEVAARDINIAWKDSLPKDPRELAELTKTEAGSTAVKPLLQAIMDNYGIDEATAESYVQKILEEQQTFATLKRSGNNSDDDTQNNKTKGSIMNPANDQNKNGADNPLKK